MPLPPPWLPNGRANLNGRPSSLIERDGGRACIAAKDKSRLVKSQRTQIDARAAAPTDALFWDQPEAKIDFAIIVLVMERGDCDAPDGYPSSLRSAASSNATSGPKIGLLATDENGRACRFARLRLRAASSIAYRMTRALVAKKC